MLPATFRRSIAYRRLETKRAKAVKTRQTLLYILCRTGGEKKHDSSGNRSVWCTFKKRKRIRPLLSGRVWLRWKRGGRGWLNETNSDIRAAMLNARCMCAPGASPLLPPPQPRAAHAHTFNIEQRQATCVRVCLKMSVKKQNEKTLRRCPAGRLPLHRWWSI